MPGTSRRGLWETWSGAGGRRWAISPDRILLTIALLLALGSVVSWRYHFFFKNYSRFVVEQVLPKEGALDLLSKVYGEHVNVDKAHPGNTRLDQAPGDSPYYTNYDYGGTVSVTGSDYLSVWYCLKTELEGGDPYKNIGHAFFNLKFLDHAILHGATVPDQEIGTGMSYLPGAPWLTLPFFSTNYFASLGRYLVGFKLFLAALGAVIARRCGSRRWSVALLFATLFFTCYPVDFMLDRGNTEGAVLIFVAAFYAAYLSGRAYLAAGLLAAAATAKGFPALLFVHFLFDRRYRPFAFGVVAFGALIALALAPIDAPPLAVLTELRQNMAEHMGQTLYFPNAYRFSSSLFSFVAAGLFPQSILTRNPALTTFARIYPLVALGILVALLFRLRRSPIEYRTLALTAAMVLLPRGTLAYHLIHLLVPFALLTMKVARDDEPLAIDVLLLALCAALFVAKEYGTLMFGLEWGVSVLINPLLLMAMVALASLPRRDEPGELVVASGFA